MADKRFGRKGSWRSRVSALGVAVAVLGLSMVASEVSANAPTHAPPHCPEASPCPSSSTSPTVTVTGSCADAGTDVVIYEVATDTTPVAGGPCSGGTYIVPVSLLANNNSSTSYTLEAAEIDSSGDLGPISPSVTVDVTSNQLVTYGDFGGTTQATNDLYYYLPCDTDACDASYQEHRFRSAERPLPAHQPFGGHARLLVPDHRHHHPRHPLPGRFQPAGRRHHRVGPGLKRVSRALPRVRRRLGFGHRCQLRRAQFQLRQRDHADHRNGPRSAVHANVRVRIPEFQRVDGVQCQRLRGGMERDHRSVRPLRPDYRLGAGFLHPHGHIAEHRAVVYRPGHELARLARGRINGRLGGTHGISRSLQHVLEHCGTHQLRR